MRNQRRIDVVPKTENVKKERKTDLDQLNARSRRSLAAIKAAQRIANRESIQNREIMKSDVKLMTRDEIWETTRDVIATEKDDAASHQSAINEGNFLYYLCSEFSLHEIRFSQRCLNECFTLKILSKIIL